MFSFYRGREINGLSVDTFPNLWHPPKSVFHLVLPGQQCALTRAALGSPAERAALGGVNITPLLTKKRFEIFNC